MEAIFERLIVFGTRSGIVSSLNINKEISSEAAAKDFVSVLGSKASKENMFSVSHINIPSLNRFRYTWSRLFISSFARGFIWQSES